MVSFSCEACNDTLKKKDLDKHKGRCRGATFTCLDCMVHFAGADYRSHTSCISEAQKYEGHLYRDKKKGKGDKRQSVNGNDASQAMIPRQAYVQDAGADGSEVSQTVAVVDVPPKAPSPPPAPENINVFDFLVTEETPNGKKKALHASDEGRMLEQHYANGDSQYSQYSTGDGSQYLHHGFSYGNTPVPQTMDRYDSWHNMADSNQHSQTLMPPPYATPAPKESRKERKSEKSDKKRKRQQVEELDLTSSTSKRPTSHDEHMADAPSTAHGARVLHSGLTGGLSKLVTDPEFYSDRIEAGPTPISPVKRSKRATGSMTTETHREPSTRDHHRDERESKKDRRKSSYTSYSTTTITPSTSRPTSTKPHDAQPPPRQHHLLPPPQTHSRHRRGSRDTYSLSSDDTHGQHGGRTSRSHHHHHHHPSRPSSVQPPTTSTALTTANSRADLFLSLVQKGPESERGCSVNKVLKRYHRETDSGSRGGGSVGPEREEGDKELWRGLRLRRNSRGEVVVFM